MGGPADRKMEKIALGISSCLLGEAVRFDSGHKFNSYIVSTLGEFFEYTPFCPEMSIGLGVPREPIRLVEQEGELKCIGTRTDTLDVTDRLIQCAHEQQHWHATIFGYILKKDSPSCGMERVRVYKNDMPERNGSGLYAKTLMHNFPNLPIEEEGRLGDPILRENFIQRVFIYKRWHEMLDAQLSWPALMNFHAQHKLILFSHDQNQARTLGKSLSQSGHLDISTFAEQYLSGLMSILKIHATRKNHVNVLQHIQGYLKNRLDKADKQELNEIIEQYRLGRLPLIVPITILRHHFRKYPDEYIDNSFYMNPHPRELMLLNTL